MKTVAYPHPVALSHRLPARRGTTLRLGEKRSRRPGQADMRGRPSMGSAWEMLQRQKGLPDLVTGERRIGLSPETLLDSYEFHISAQG